MSCSCAANSARISQLEADIAWWKNQIAELQRLIRDAQGVIRAFNGHKSEVNQFKHKMESAKNASHGRFEGNLHKTKYQAPLGDVSSALSEVTGAIDTNISALDNKIDDYEGRITEREGWISEAEGEISSLESEISACEVCNA